MRRRTSSTRNEVARYEIRKPRRDQKAVESRGLRRERVDEIRNMVMFWRVVLIVKDRWV
jgi:hypothetical protein